MKFLLAFFLFFSSLFAQYTKNDFKLVKTTATREFNKSVILDYINSGNDEKTIAGLLSASNSQDTSFVPDILKLNFSKYGETLCFAVGQVGPSFQGQGFLYNKLVKNETGKFAHEVLDALGKVADESTAALILEKASSNEIKDRDGISIFIFNLFSRRVPFDKAKVKDILLSEIKNKSSRRRIEALFTAARLGGIKEAEKTLITILTSKDKINPPQVKTFALGCFTREKYFPHNKKLILQVLTHKDWRVRVEAAKAVSYLGFTLKADIKNYFKLVSDPNPNVARQAAISVRNIKSSKVLLAHLKTAIETGLNGKGLNSTVKGELFISFCSLFPKNSMTLIKKYDKRIEEKYIYEVLLSPEINPAEAYAYLSKKKQKKEKDLLDLAPALLGLLNKLPGNNAYDKEILSLLDSKYSSVSSTIADGIDSTFASVHKAEIKKTITAQISAHINDAAYYETLVSYYNLSKRVDSDFNASVTESLKKSGLYSLRRFLEKEKGNDKADIKEFTNFNELWKNAFAYSKAKVTTKLGSFTIKFYPGYAPISVGNFITLAKRGFYDDVVFHRVVPNFVAQTGDSTGTGFGGPGYDIISEFSTLPFNTDYVGMASAGRDTEGSQWFVMHNIALHLYGRYTVFGKVIEGAKIIPLINQGDKIISVKLIK